MWLTTYGLLLSSPSHAVGNSVQQSGLSDAASVVVDDDGRFSMPLVAHNDFLAPHVDWRFVTFALKAECAPIEDRSSLRIRN